MSHRDLLRRLVETPKHGQLDWLQEKQDQLNAQLRREREGQDDMPKQKPRATRATSRTSRTSPAKRLTTHLQQARETLIYGPDMAGAVPKSVGIFDRANAVIALVVTGQLSERDARTIGRNLAWAISEAKLELATAVKNKTLQPGSNVLPSFRRLADVPPRARGRRR